MYISEAEQWTERAGMLTQEQCGKLVEEVLLWRLIEEGDFKLKGRVLV